MKINLRKEELVEKVKSIVEFYDFVSEEIGYYSPSNKYDCRKIEVSNKIQDFFYELYKNENKCEDWEITMILLQYGPKVNESLNDYEVLIEQGYITNNLTNIK